MLEPRFRCQCCHYEKTFKTAQAAFDEGWDVPPYFTFIITCERCPSSFLLMDKIPEGHLLAHKQWLEDGRG